MDSLTNRNASDMCNKCHNNYESQHHKVICRKNMRQYYHDRKEKLKDVCFKCSTPYTSEDHKKCRKTERQLRKQRINSGLCGRCGRVPQFGKMCESCKQENRENGLLQRLKLKNTVLKHYGEWCACCEENIIDFLTIDHINGGGTKHLKEINCSIYVWLVRNEFPSDFQVLCANCNFGKMINKGVCPHKEARNEK